MARACSRAVQANALLIREMKQLRRNFNNFLMGAATTKDQADDREGGTPPYNSSNWVPHPRTGIYFPEGHEWVMKDVPENAASCTRVCWFRDSDGDGTEDQNRDEAPSAARRLAAALGGRN